MDVVGNRPLGEFKDMFWQNFRKGHPEEIATNRVHDVIARWAGGEKEGISASEASHPPRSEHARQHERHASDLSSQRFEVGAHVSRSLVGDGFSDCLQFPNSRLAQQQKRREQC